MQKILGFLTILVFIFSGQAKAVNEDACFEFTYLTQAMRWIPTNCSEATEALLGFDEQANRLNSINHDWTQKFVQDNRDTMVARVKNLCKNA